VAKRADKPDGDEQKPVQPNTNEQSGSTGRPTAAPNGGSNRNSGQDRYGQSGGGGKADRETEGQTKYRESGSDGSARRPGGAAVREDRGSNQGSGRADREVNGVDPPAATPRKKH
jgi:hypothetical protein